MNCFYHPDQPAVAACSDCGKGLCQSCASKWNPPLCNDCASTRIGNHKMSAKKAAIGGLILWGVIAVIGIIAVLSEGIHGFSGLVKGVGGAIAAGYFIAGIPSGWRALTKITPNIFLFMPVIGWVIYFGAKLFLAIFVGVVAFPINLLQNFFHIAKAERLEQHLK